MDQWQLKDQHDLRIRLQHHLERVHSNEHKRAWLMDVSFKAPVLTNRVEEAEGEKKEDSYDGLQLVSDEDLSKSGHLPSDCKGFYAILGVAPSAELSTIKAAYRKCWLESVIPTRIPTLLPDPFGMSSMKHMTS